MCVASLTSSSGAAHRECLLAGMFRLSATSALLWAEHQDGLPDMRESKRLAMKNLRRKTSYWQLTLPNALVVSGDNEAYSRGVLAFPS